MKPYSITHPSSRVPSRYPEIEGSWMFSFEHPDFGLMHQTRNGGSMPRRSRNTSPEIWQRSWFLTKWFDGRVKRNKWIQNWMCCHVLSIHDTSEFQAKSGSSRHFARSLQHFWTASGPTHDQHLQIKWSKKRGAAERDQQFWVQYSRSTVLQEFFCQPLPIWPMAQAADARASG